MGDKDTLATRVVRNLNVPLQNGGIATFPVPMTPADHVLLTAILNELKAVHVREATAIAYSPLQE